MFPDIANVEFIRNALWRHKGTGDASIMIGAGFSRNADAVSASVRPMPNWAQMAEELCTQLYGGDVIRHGAALKDASATSGFLRLAQEYQVAFGPSALSARIRDLVPDVEYRPGDLHKRLLRLPWADVFSTNWDTLLERTCADVFERNYEVISTVEQIPFTTRPRIVKLHGTFPAHEPFIFTEEEYRRFPIEFSPFVNLVQQSMMETIFCLLGFSGDDPNFLHWSGWVRDNLRQKAPKIYLVGWLDLSVHRRRMLEERNVMPVDLAALPQGKDWPRDQRHRYATDWFIRALEAGKPYDFSNWPTAPEAPPPPPSFLAPIPSVTSALPRKEEWPAPSHPPPPKEDRIEALRRTVAVWTHNRHLYPGWLIAPEHVRQHLWELTVAAWVREILALLEDLSSFEKLRTLSELVWRLNKALYPLFSEFEDPAFSVIDTVDRAALTVGGSAVPGDVDWLDILSGCNQLALALARNARHIGNAERFERALSYLSLAAVHVADLRHVITYERCLWDLAAGNLQSLNALLQTWTLNEADTLWLLRKAGLLAEIRDNRSACDVLETALIQIRRTRRRDIDDIFTLSRESWALYLALAYRSGRSLIKSPELPDDLPEPFQRWRELAMVECDAFSEYQTLARLLEYTKPPQSEVTRRRSFDADREGVTYHLGGGGPSSSVRAAYEMMLLSEETGIPPAANHAMLFEKGLTEAAKILSADEPWLATSVSIRIGNDHVLDYVLSRPRLATMPASLIPLLRGGMLNRLAYGMSILGSTTSFVDEWVHLTGITIEVLSRLALRLPVDQLTQLFNQIMAYYRLPMVRRLSVFLGEPLGKLLGRILEALPTDEIEPLLPDLFGMLLVHDAGLEADEYRWVDPVALLPAEFKPANPTAPLWSSPLVARLIDAAAGTDNANREAALFRLYKLWNWNWLSEDETNKFGEALWVPAHLGDRGLPSHTRFLAWAFMTLPAPASIDRRAAISSDLSWLIERSDGNSLERLYAIGILLSEAERLATPLELPESAGAAVLALIEAWTSTRLSPGLPGLFSREEDQRERNAIIGVKVLLLTIELTEPLKAAIWEKITDLNGNRQRAVRAYALYPTLIQLLPERREVLSTQLRRALGSDLEDEARLAVSALYEWTRDSMRMPEKFAQPSRELFREIGIAIAARRAAILRVALDIARWLFGEGPREIAEMLAEDCEYGLTALQEEASYSRRDAPFDVPGIRAACVRLASAMRGAGFGSGPGTSGWISAAEDDPLPEVRRAASQRLV